LKRHVLPLYHQLRELLLEKIDSGEWAPGYQLPAEKDISAEYGVSRATVRQAMQFLENQGLIERFQGKGTFVGRPKVASNLMTLFNPVKGLTSVKELPRFVLRHLRTVPAGALVAGRLGIDPADHVFDVERSIIVDGEPVMIVRNWLAVSRFPDFEEKFAKTATVLRAIQHYGINSVQQHKELEITILDYAEAEGLDVQPGSPALLVTYLTRTIDGEPFEYRKVIVRGDRCKYYVDINLPEPLL